MLLAADAAGALVAGMVLEGEGSSQAKPRTAIILAMLWCIALAGFSLATSYPLALAFLFTAGFFELSFNAMAQTLVQVKAPVDIRGRVIGLFNMASLGLRAFSGVSVGLLGSFIGVHWSLGLSALVMLAIAEQSSRAAVIQSWPVSPRQQDFLDNIPQIPSVRCARPQSHVGPARRKSGKARMSKQDMREEAERLVKEAMERKTVTIKQGNTRIETKCGKCGAPNRVTASPGETRVSYTCKECGAKQVTL